MPLHGPSQSQVIYAARLRRMREDQGLSFGQVAGAIGASPATVRRLEDADTSLDEGMVRMLLELYGRSAEEITEWVHRLKAANEPGWWAKDWGHVMSPWLKKLMAVEDSAEQIRTWHPCLVPPLLRTRSYALAIAGWMDADATEEERIAEADLLMERQRRLADRGTVVWALMTQAGLYTRFSENEAADAEVMAEQIEALDRAIARPSNTKVHVFPLGAPPHALSSTGALHYYRIGKTLSREIRDTVVLEQPKGAGGARTKGTAKGTRRPRWYAYAEVVTGESRVAEHLEQIDLAASVAPHVRTPLPIHTEES
ncbi:Scr1 family TA system antitoxin-like transcriptional regulator [Streptomyces niveus]|uniref:Scr1 family TA system antitoxin-like transcriptional regulator n=1 Tax=Streptomyces niveus TaxID=193462 RepID=UPI0036CDF17B